MNRTEGKPPLRENAQDHFSVAVRKRDWSLFLFFRVLPNAEVARRLALAAQDSKNPERIKVHAELIKGEFAYIDPEAISFHDLPLAWAPEQPPVQLDRSYFLEFLKNLLGEKKTPLPKDVENFIDSRAWMPDAFSADDAQKGADDWFSEGLLGICLHEALRYGHKHGWVDPLPLLRAYDPAVKDAANYVRGKERVSAENRPRGSVNIAFTHSGLAALKKVSGGKEAPVLNPELLVSFPDSFRQGMAARARALGDIGRSAPENWEGELGKPSVHGMLLAHFDVTTHKFRHWDDVRKEVEAFNNGCPELRAAIGQVFLGFGFEVVHIEFGQAPYEQPESKDCDFVRPADRREHFGFRDGISQPFVDLGLKTPLPGGGTPGKDGSWMPVATGEIFLGEPDEDGLIAHQPANDVLRDDGTYLVFRKLEQDVAGLRSYLEHERKPEDRERLAAQFVGRWPNGAPLVRHPDFDAAYVGNKGETSLNDFRYRSEDPYGVKCPIGAHIRRTNPRDTGGRNEAKYHRILRRSMSYGGPFLPERSKGDGRSRGLLFMAANARIEMQFEVMQRDWINSGEFIGQVGAGRCPLTGANSGLPQDRFLEAGAIAPISGIPSFVTMKGGDYFFVPSIRALNAIAKGELDEVQRQQGTGRFSNSISETPAMQTVEKIRDYASVILGQNRAVRIRLPREQNDYGPSSADTTFVFIGQYNDVSKVLAGRPEDGKPPAFSVAHYLKASRQITRGSAQLLAMDEGGELGDKRAQRLEIMNDARTALGWGTNEHNSKIRQFIRREVDRIVHRVARHGQIDVLQDLAFYISYRLVEELIGISGPRHLSELAVALPFAKRYITQLPPDWLKGRSPAEVADPGYATMQIWSRLAFAEVIGNVLNRRELTQAAIQATSELLTHIDEKITEERWRRPRPAQADNFLAQLVLQPPPPDMGEDEYFNEVRTILADLVVTISTNIALPFSKALQSALNFGFNLAWLVPQLEAASKPERQFVELLAYELLRLAPSAPAIYRRCEIDTRLPSGAEIKAGEWVACLLPVAGQDWGAFPDQPNRFSLGKDVPPHLQAYGPAERDAKNYLLFGPSGGVHRCWGEALGKLVLAELFHAAARFPGLTRVAGPAGRVVELPSRMDYSLKLKFYPFDPNRKSSAALPPHVCGARNPG